MIRLLLKYYDNGKKYLCKTVRDDYMEYRGSGRLITKDLTLIKTEVLFESEDSNEFSIVAKEYSEMWEVDTNSDFLNLCYEEGQGGNVGKNSYEKARQTKVKLKNRNNVKLLQKYKKKFRFTFGGGQWLYYNNKWIDEKLNDIYNILGSPDEVDWNYCGSGRGKSNGKKISESLVGKTKGMVSAFDLRTGESVGKVTRKEFEENEFLVGPRSKKLRRVSS